jgi:hypothetical protein
MVQENCILKDGNKIYALRIPMKLIQCEQNIQKYEQTPSLLVRKRTIPTERPLRPALQWRILLIEGDVCSAQRIPTTVNLGFINQSPTFSFKQLLTYPQEVGWTPSQTRYFSEKPVAQEIEPETSWSVASNSNH